MSGYLRRLATTGAAYTAASILSKLIAVALLPLYTRYRTPEDYGAAEVLFAAGGGGEHRRSAFAGLFWLSALGALVALPFAGPISEALLKESAPDLVRIAIGGLWVLTMYEFLLTLFRSRMSGGAWRGWS